VLRALDAAIWGWVTMMLWRVNQQGRLFVVVISALNSIPAEPSVPGASTFPAILPDGALLISSLMPGVRDAFGVGSAITGQR
jgi:hypothetical protein